MKGKLEEPSYGQQRALEAVARAAAELNRVSALATAAGCTDEQIAPLR